MLQSKTCRLCTKSTISRNYKNLFGKDHKLVTQIEEITGILLKNVISLPQYICKVCLKDLEKAHDFRVRCITSQEYFSSVDFTATKDLPFEDIEIKCEIPIFDEFNNDPGFCTPENIFVPEIETKDELIDDNNLAESCFLKAKSEDGRQSEDGLSDIDNSNSSHSNYSDDMHNDALSLTTSANVKDNATKLNATLVPQQKKLKRTRRKRIKNSEKEIFVCDECGMVFPIRSLFLAHQRRHTGEKPFHCDICRENFREKFQLKRHMRKHIGEKPFACEFCDLRFSKNDTRKLHIRRKHTNERPYACVQCTKAFAASYMLTQHMLTHTGEKTFRCDECDIWFGRKTNLLRHYRCLSHKQIGLKPPVEVEKTKRCDVCDVWFGRNTSMAKHYRSLGHKQNEQKTTEDVEKTF